MKPFKFNKGTFVQKTAAVDGPDGDSWYVLKMSRSVYQERANQCLWGFCHPASDYSQNLIATGRDQSSLGCCNIRQLWPTPEWVSGR